MTLPTFSELLASLHLSNADSPVINAESDLILEARAQCPLAINTANLNQPAPSSGASGAQARSPTRHIRCTSSFSSLSSSASAKHFPSSSPSIVVTNDHHTLDNSTLSFDTCIADPGEAPNNHIRLTRHSTRSIKRFTPYSGASNSVHIRRSSLPDDLQDAAKPTPELEIPDRPSTVSPRLLTSGLQLENIDTNIVVDKPSPSPSPSLSLSSHPQSPHHHHSSSSPPFAPQQKLMPIDIENRPDVPISSFARRKTPQSSPTLTNFRQKRRFASLSPVLLPRLLPGLHPVHSSDSENVPCEAVATLTATESNPRVVRQHGLRLSSYRSFYISRSRSTIGTPCL